MQRVTQCTPGEPTPEMECPLTSRDAAQSGYIPEWMADMLEVTTGLSDEQLHQGADYTVETGYSVRNLGIVVMFASRGMLDRAIVSTMGYDPDIVPHEQAQDTPYSPDSDKSRLTQTAISVAQHLRGGAKYTDVKFHEIYEAALPYIKGVIYKYGLRGDDHDEAVSRSLEKLVRYMHTFKGDSEFGTWLHMLVTRVCHSTVSVSGRKKSTEIHLDEEFETSSPLHEQPDHVFLFEELSAKLQYAMSQMTPAQLELISMRTNGRTYDQIAEHLGITPTAAKVRVHRARQALHKKLIEPSTDQPKF